MKVLINFANENFKNEQRYNSITGLKNGGFDKVIEYSTKDIDSAFYEKNKDILENQKGAGLWLWKPYFILKTLNILKEGDYLFYCDAGSFFVNSINNLINCLERDKCDFMAFDYPMLNIQFTKLSFIETLGIDTDEWKYSSQLMGGFLLIKNSFESRNFISEYLILCEKKELLSDPDIDQQQHPLFVAHRHDQCILSYLQWKYKFSSYKDPSQNIYFPLAYIKYGKAKIGQCLGCFKNHKESNYPPIVILYRKAALYKALPRFRFLIKYFVKRFVSRTFS